MKDRVQFCDKITTESLLKSNTIQEQFKLFETEIKNNFEIKTESYHPFMTHQGYGRKQPLRGVPRKRCSDNLQQICTSGCLFLYGVQEKPKEFFYTGNLK